MTEPDLEPSLSTPAPGRSNWAWLVLLGLLPIAAFAWLALGGRPQPAVDEASILRLAAAGRFDDAQAALVDHLQASPRDPRAHFLLAQILIDRTDLPADLIDPDLANQALDHLDRTDAIDPRGASVDSAQLQLYRGKALYQLRRWDAAERAWLAALRLDPRVPEAGWSLLDLYYLESRHDDARRLALQLFEVEPEPRDRAQLLLELVRRDAIPPSPLSLIPLFEAAQAAEPDAVYTPIALAHSLIRNSETDRGLAILRDLVAQHPESLPVYEGLLNGLDLANQPSTVTESLRSVPDRFAGNPELARFRALAAQSEGRWPDAADDLRLAVDRDPTDFESLNRLERTLRFAGSTAEADRVADLIGREREARKGLLDLYEKAGAVPTLGVRPHPELCDQLATLRLAMRRPDEAELWRAVIGPGLTSTRRPSDD